MATIRFLKQNNLVNSYFKIKYKNNYVRQVKIHSMTEKNDVFDVPVSLSNGAVITLSTGKYARMADGCAVVTSGDTSVMATTVGRIVSSNVSSIVPLVVDYKQKAAAAGRIPTNFLRRELGTTSQEILTGRMIDRSLRPLFPKNFNIETQIMCNILAIDESHNPDLLAINAASAALAVSDIPWNGPVGAVRVGFIDNEVIINPVRHELQQSILNLVVTATSQNLVVMLEGSANNILEQDLRKALKAGVKECQHIIEGINKLQKQFGKQKRVIEPAPELSEEIIESIKLLSEMKLRNIFSCHEYDKISRDNAINDVKNEVLTTLKKTYNELDIPLALEAFSQYSKELFRSNIMDNNIRCDGRSLTDLRKINCEVNLFKPLHGSALFQRGQTQVMCTVTLDSPDSALKMDTVTMLASGLKEKNFFLHYEFPPYATNETGRAGVIGRRETGHGALAEKALTAVIPSNYPFTIRLTSEVLESNGSSSMASVCGGSLALMDAGVPISTHAAGVAIGLITKYDTSTKNITDYKILTDILGIEDYLGDMDFKLAGTKKGITALQADIKIPGLPLKIIMESIDCAREAKHTIINIMNQTIVKPRLNKKENMPVTETIDVPAHLIGKLMGAGGSNIKKIFIETGVHINKEADSTKFNIFAPNQAAMEEAKLTISELIKHYREPTLEFGGIYTAKVVEIKETGVMVTLYPSMPPAFLHNSQLDQRQINHPSALGLEIGQEIQVKYFGRDPASGEVRLSRKVLQTTNFVAKDFSSRAT